MERFLAVTDRDLNYAKRLCAYISEKRTLPFVTVSFGKAEDYLEFSGSHDIAVHIFDGETFEDYCRENHSEEEEGELREKLINERTVFLYKSRLLEDETEEGITEYSAKGIYKYRPAAEILRKAMDIYSRSTGRLKYVDKLGKTVIAGVYSPVSRCKKTTFALLLSEAYGRDRRVLYINLEEFSGFFAFTGVEETEDLSDVLYYLKENSLDFPKLKALVRPFKNFEYIPPVRFPEDRGGTETGDYVELMECISDIGDYDVIVVDMQSFSGCASELMEICDEIYMPVAEDFVSKEKLRDFEKYMQRSDRLRLMERIRRIKLPEEASNAASSDSLDRLIYSSAGDYVRKLVS
ncbi:MAG: hypothetical protein ACOYBV_09405 [Candidatus Avilachnospira sp.]|jgi:hypothetical protein